MTSRDSVLMRTCDLIYVFDTKVAASSDCDLISQQETTHK